MSSCKVPERAASDTSSDGSIHAPNSGGFECSRPISSRIVVGSARSYSGIEEGLGRGFQASFRKGSNPSVERLSKDGKKGAEPSPSATTRSGLFYCFNLLHDHCTDTRARAKTTTEARYGRRASVFIGLSLVVPFHSVLQAASHRSGSDHSLLAR